nr:MAG TPA: hypothetical protein [Caudoviricetes sp.]
MGKEIIDASQQVAVLTQELTLEVLRSDDFAVVYKLVDNMIETMTAAKKQADEKIKALMKEEYLRTGNQTIKANGITATYVPGGVRETFDAKAFKADDPETYAKYVKVSSTSDSLRMKVKKEEV